jgi:hypothetical protein
VRARKRRRSERQALGHTVVLILEEGARGASATPPSPFGPAGPDYDGREGDNNALLPNDNHVFVHNNGWCGS